MSKKIDKLPSIDINYFSTLCLLLHFIYTAHIPLKGFHLIIIDWVEIDN